MSLDSSIIVACSTPVRNTFPYSELHKLTMIVSHFFLFNLFLYNVHKVLNSMVTVNFYIDQEDVSVLQKYNVHKNIMMIVECRRDIIFSLLDFSKCNAIEFGLSM